VTHGKDSTAAELTVTTTSRVDAWVPSARESQCCSFLRFDFTPDADGLVLRVEVPEEYVDVLDALEIRVRQIGCAP
jgi:hypothetical protein